MTPARPRAATCRARSKLRSTKDVLNLGTGVGTDLQYTDTYYDKPYETPKKKKKKK